MADEIDLAHLPSGQLAWRTLVDQISKVDATAERHFYELKSEIDLNTTVGRPKVAKFILGAANRDPDTAARRFDGRALMFLGIGEGTTPGIEGFEAMELQRYVNKFTGMPGPDWDFERIEVENGRAVIVVIVGPPDATKQPWACEADGLKMFNGRMYIRGDGDTREATGAEIKVMLARSKTAIKPQVDLDVEIVGSVRAYVWDEAVLDDYLARKREWFLDALPKPTKTRMLSPYEANRMGVDIKAILAASSQVQRGLGGFGGSTPEGRTKDEYTAQIDEWEAKVRERMQPLLDRAAGYAWHGVTVKINNQTDTYLDQPEFRIHLAGAVDALDKASSVPELMKELPRPPRRWGPTSNLSSMLGIGPQIKPYIPNFSPIARSNFGVVRYKNGGSVSLDFTLEALRPRAAWTSDDDDFLLITRDPELTEFRGTWEATVRGHNAVYEGELVVEANTKVNDFSTWITNQLAADKDVGAKAE